MDVKVLGAANEVGRSGFLVNCNGTKLLLDYGVMFGKKRFTTRIPTSCKTKRLGCHNYYSCPFRSFRKCSIAFVSGNTDVYATPPTFDLSKLLIEDMLKIEKNAHPFGLPELNNMMKNAKEIGFKQKVTKENATFEFRESGHVVGGSTVLVESEKKRLFYTGDIKTNGSRMLREMDMDIGEIDLLITESTYAKTEQIPRKESETQLIEFANEVMDRKGILFIPSFSVERSQEMACILRSANFKHKIIMDGMALKVNEIMFKHPEYLRDPKIFAEAIKSSTAIREHAERKRAMGEPCVVISPAGMLVGGNAVYYLQQLSFDSKNGIALVSYQGEGTPGKKLLDTGKVSTRGKDLNVTAEVKQFQFSGHADKKELFDMIKKVKGNPKVWTVHGDSESCDLFAQEIHEKFGFETFAPAVNDEITV